MAPRYRRVAVIGTGPSGLSAVKALHDENTFDTIRVFERRDRVGGIWHYDPTPDPFYAPGSPSQTPNNVPTSLPQFTSPRPEDTSARTGIYSHLDSNVVERVEKTGQEWTLTLRKTGQLYRGLPQDYWWTETFDAVIVASGHYNVPSIPPIPGLSTTALTHPHAFEHAKAFRHADNYTNKRVLIVGGNVSAADLVTELHEIVSGPLYISQRGINPALENAWTLPNVQRKPTLSRLEPTTPSSSTNNTVTAHFTDGTKVESIDRVIFATGYTASYPFLVPDPVTANNRVAGFYQHIFRITDPSLALVGQVRAALSFRVYEYQAVAVARYFSGRAKELPSQAEQDRWEFERLKSKGNGVAFHEIKPDFREYFEALLGIAGEGAGLPPFEDRWADEAFEILKAKDEYWSRLKRGQDRAKL
ncbi:hypothetical protein CAN33_0020360 [Aspergillus niger]|uniref:Dimethylaniline monooxygenase n=1 Tax=Aspergillus niger TaxID=5061 RepID=A0A505HZM4_ASPNG|nr:hypothetical protein CAN33_0020360 [Aspergillus niger]